MRLALGAHYSRLATLKTVFALFLLLLPLTACNAPPAATHPATPMTGITRVEITSRPLHTGVKRLGINLSGQTFYDSGQMLRNSVYRNPGFEGQSWQSILRCKAVTANTCLDANSYAVWPAGFLTGASYTVISGLANGAHGVVQSSSANLHDSGITVTLDPAPAGLEKDDFILIRQENAPSAATAGWWPSTNGGATLTTETHDLSPATLGKQALRIEAAGAGQSASVDAYFDTFAGRSFVQLRGPYTLRFRAKSLAGQPSVAVKLIRLDQTHGTTTFFSRTVPLSSTWHDFTFPFTAQEPRSALGSVQLSFSFAGTSALLDDVSLTEGAPSTDHPTAFRDSVVRTLRDLHPGILRYMDNGTDFGSSLDNMLAPPFARHRAGSSTQATVQEDQPIGLHEFLTLAKAVGAEPWYAMPPGTTPDEAANLIDYLAGPATTDYGRRRAALGQKEPWTSVFPVIHLELGNEEWNSRSFAGSSLNDPVAYARRGAQVFTAARHAPAYKPASFDLILGSWSAVPWWTQNEFTAGGSAFDTVAVAPYLFTDFNDAATNERIFGPMFAQPEQMDARPGGQMTEQARTLTGHSARLAIYETNLGALSGSATQPQLDAAIPSLGAGLTAVDHMLLMLRELGITTQCVFALPEYQNGFGSGSPSRTIPLWGSVIDMGGATDRRRPSYLATQLANEALLPTELAITLTGDNPTWDQPLSPNDKIELKSAHLLQTFAFTDGPHRSLVLLNLSRTDPLTIQLTGPNRPTGVVDGALLTSAHMTDSNEESEQVRVVRSHKPSPETLRLPAFSMTTLRWTP